MDPITFAGMALSKELVPVYTMNSAADNINEGSDLSLTVTTQYAADGDLYWEVTENPGDFSVTTGTVTISNSSGSFTVTPTADNTTEGAESFTVKLFTDSARTNEVASVSNLTINDTSQAAAARYWRFYYHAYGSNIAPVYLYWVVGSNATEIAAYAENGQVNTGSSTSWNYQNINMATYAGQTGRFAFVSKEPAGPFGDFALDDMRYVNSSGSSSYYDGRSSGNRAKWKHQNTGNGPGSTSASAAALASATDNISTYSSSSRKNCWCYDSGGGTPTSATGPSAAINGNSGTDYIYYEANQYSDETYSGNDYYRAMIMDNTITLN